MELCHETFVQDQASFMHIDCSCESDLLACANYAINHRVPILNGFENLPVNAFHDLTYGGVVHASAVSYNWMDAASAWHPNIITISSPCQQWSGAGHGKGLYSMEGLLLPESICMSRFLQPEFIAVEQVSGFACHDHKHKVMQTISMCGYQVVWSRTVDLAWFGPLNRSRWLALLQRVVDMPPVDAPVLHFPTMSNWIPNNYDALFPFDDGLDTQLLISPQMRAVVHDVRYLPAAKRVKLGTQNAMTQRTHDGSQKFPVFMATYGVQHTLPEHLLQEKGCMAHFYADPQHGARLLHPHEMALLHGVSESFFAFNDFRSSWKHLGNQIAVQHALIPLTMACMTFDIPGDKVTVSEALQTWEEHRLKASQVVVESGKAGTLMRHVEACCDLTNVQHEHIHDLVVNWSKGAMPSHVSWDVNGFHEFTTEVHSHSEGNTMIEGHQCSLPAVANPHDHDIGPIRSAIPTVDTSECTDVVHTKDTVVLPGDVMMPKAADLASEATTSSECIRAREVHVMSGPNQVSRSPVFTCVDSPVSVLPPPCSNQDCPMHDGEQCQSQSLTEMSGHHQNTATPVLPEAATPADAAVALSTEPTVCSGAEKPETAAISASEATALNESSHVPESHAMSGSLHVSMSPVTPAEHSPESVLSLPCCPTVPAVIKLGNQEHNFWIAADVVGHQCSLPAVANPHDHDIGPIRSAIPTVDTSECTDVVHTKDTVVLPGDVMMPKAADLASEATTSSECIRAREVHVMSGPNQVSRSPVFTCVDSPVSVLPPPCSNQDCPMHDGEQCQSQSLTEMSGHHQNTATPVLPEAATPADAAVALSTEPTVCSGAEKPETAAISASEATALNESSHVPESHAMSGSLHVSMSPVTPAEHSPESVLSLPCCPTVPAVIKLGNQEHNFWIAADVVPQDLSALWHGNLTTQHTDTAVYITPDANAGSVTLDHNMLVTMMDNQLTVFAFEGTDLKSFCKDRCDRQVLYDQYGRIAKDQKFQDELLITPFPQKHCQSCKDALTLLAACHNCVITMQYVQPIDTIVVSFSGEQESRKIMAELYAGAIHQDTLDDLNRTCYVTHDPVMPTTQVHFAPADTGLPVPPAVFPRVLAIALTRRMMDTLMTTDGMLMQLKWESRPLWFGRIDQYATAEVVNAILQQSMAPMCKLKETRLVHRGKQFASGFFHTCKQENGEDIIYTFLIALEMSGGAGPAATKTQLRQQVRNGVAAWLLESGIELTWTHDNIEKILDDVGIKKLVPIVAQPASQRRDSQLHQALIDASIQLPKTQPKVNNSPQILKAKSKRRALPSLDPSDFKVDCTYLLHEDGQPTTQISEFRANKQGVYMTDPAGALPWLRENQQLSTDELGMLVLGPLPTDTSLPTQEIVIPCYNSDANQVLLQLTLVQFGSKHLKMKDWDKTPMKAATSKVISITLWRQDWSSEEWEAALQHTTQFVKDVMVTEGLQTAITSCWGRSLRKGRQPATNKDATSIQIHAAIADDQFLPVLKLSGTQQIVDGTERCRWQTDR